MPLIHQEFGDCKGATRKRDSDPEYISYRLPNDEITAPFPFGEYGWQYILDVWKDGYVAIRDQRLIILHHMPESAFRWRGAA